VKKSGFSRQGQHKKELRQREKKQNWRQTEDPFGGMLRHIKTSEKIMTSIVFKGREEFAASQNPLKYKVNPLNAST